MGNNRRKNKTLTLKQAEMKLHKKVIFKENNTDIMLVGTVFSVYFDADEKKIMFGVNNVSGRAGNEYHLPQTKFDFM